MIFIQIAAVSSFYAEFVFGCQVLSILINKLFFKNFIKKLHYIKQNLHKILHFLRSLHIKPLETYDNLSNIMLFNKKWYAYSFTTFVMVLLKHNLPSFLKPFVII